MNVNFDYIILATEHSKLIKVKEVFAVEGNQKTLWCGFQFRTSDWNDMEKTVVFQKKVPRCSTENTPIHIILDKTGCCEIPSEVLSTEGEFLIGIYGIKDNQRLVSNFITVDCQVGCYSNGTVPDEPTASIYEQIRNELSIKQDKLVPGENILINSNNVISSKSLVVNASTKDDFPIVGNVKAIYKAIKEQKIYQWDEEKLEYIPLSGSAEIGIASATALGGIKVGNNLAITDTGVLSVMTTDVAEQDNTKPITSAAVNTIVGNIDALLSII